MTVLAETAVSISNASRSPTFVDLRAFVAEVKGSFAALKGRQDKDAFLSNRTALLNASGETPIAAVLLPAGSGRVDALPHDEFLLVLEGRLSVTTGQQTYVLEADDAAVISHGCSLTWHAEEAVTAIILGYAESRATDRTITPLLKNPPLAPSGKPAPEVLLSPAPDCRNFNDYRVDDGKFVCGTWDSTPYRRKGFRYAHHEIMLITQGAVTFGDENGRSATFGEGSLVLAESGSHCSWDSSEPVTKTFAIYRT